MIDRIAQWTARNGADFAAFSAMVALWSSDDAYWSSQPMTRLHAEATGMAPRKVAPAPFRV